MKNDCVLSNEVKEIIEKNIKEIDLDIWDNVIADCAKGGLKLLLDFREALLKADIDLTGFDAQVCKMITSYYELSKIIKFN